MPVNTMKKKGKMPVVGRKRKDRTYSREWRRSDEWGKPP